MPYGVLKPHAFLAVSSALPLNPSSTPDEIIASGSEPAEEQLPVCLVATSFHLVEGKCKLETRTHNSKNSHSQFTNSHPHGKTCSTFRRGHQSGHGFRKLIRLLENAVAMAV